MFFLTSEDLRHGYGSRTYAGKAFTCMKVNNYLKRGSTSEVYLTLSLHWPDGMDSLVIPLSLNALSFSKRPVH